MTWLIKSDRLEAFEIARAKGLQIPPAVVESFTASTSRAASGGPPRIFTQAGEVAQILVEGVLTPRPDVFAYYFGGGNTTYPEIIQSLALAAADPTIKRVVLNVCSPGGAVSGLFDALAALEAFPKPKETIASQADSAAYGIAALGGKITATNNAAEFGSIGVCATYVQYDFQQVFEITSSNAPNKRPDPSTKEGQATIRKYLDDIEGLFVAAIARGRGTTTEDVTGNFGRGAVMLAGRAKEFGMIDSISGDTHHASAPEVATTSGEVSLAERIAEEIERQQGKASTVAGSTAGAIADAMDRQRGIAARPQAAPTVSAFETQIADELERLGGSSFLGGRS